MKILSIGNSFSQDAQFYLHRIAQSAGADVESVNLYIPGCPLSRHAENIENDAPAYLYEKNGESTGRYVSISQTLDEGGWDVVTLQQVSGKAGIFTTYLPYLTLLADYVRARSGNSILYIHQTWAYEIDSGHPDFTYYEKNREKMHECVRDAYKSAAELIGADIIPVGDVIAALRKTEPFIYERGGISLCRDGFHMNMLYGRYAAAATFYEKLSGDIAKAAYIPEYKGERADANYIEIIKKCVKSLG